MDIVTSQAEKLPVVPHPSTALASTDGPFQEISLHCSNGVARMSSGSKHFIWPAEVGDAEPAVTRPMPDRLAARDLAEKRMVLLLLQLEIGVT
jgi:hypothetical protein